MGTLRIAALVIGLWGSPALGLVEIMIGDNSTTGSVVRPMRYKEAVAGATIQKFNFDNQSPGDLVNQQKFGSLSISSLPASRKIIAQQNLIAGSEPGSDPIALLVEGSTDSPTDLSLELDDPVSIVGFVLMGLGSSSQLKVFDNQNTLLVDYTIPPSLPGMRKWVGVVSDDLDILRVRLEPAETGEYGIDDVELAEQTPEPVSLMMWSCLVLVLTSRGAGRGRQIYSRGSLKSVE